MVVELSRKEFSVFNKKIHINDRNMLVLMYGNLFQGLNLLLI